MKGTCRICACTHTTACHTSSGPCFWVDEKQDLCSACMVGNFAMDEETQSALRTRMNVESTALECCAIIGTISLACLHPGFSGPLRVEMVQLAVELLQEMRITPNIAGQVVDRWDQEAAAQRIAIEILLGQGFMLVSTIQLASRNPGFVGPIRNTMIDLARRLTAQISLTPAIGQYLELGWNPALDITPG